MATLDLPQINDWTADLSGDPECCICFRRVPLEKLLWVESRIMGQFQAHRGRPARNIYYAGKNPQAKDKEGTPFFPCCESCGQFHMSSSEAAGFVLRSLR